MSRGVSLFQSVLNLLRCIEKKEAREAPVDESHQRPRLTGAFYFKVLRAFPTGQFGRTEGGDEPHQRPRLTEAFYMHFISKCCVYVLLMSIYWPVRPARPRQRVPIRGLVSQGLFICLLFQSVEQHSIFTGQFGRAATGR